MPLASALGAPELTCATHTHVYTHILKKKKNVTGDLRPGTEFQ